MTRKLSYWAGALAAAIPLAMFSACGDDEAADGTTTATPGGGAGGIGNGGGGGTAAQGGGGGTIGAGYDCSPSDGALPELKLTPVAQGLVQPVLAKSPPGDAGRLFILQKNGVVRLVQDGALSPTPFIDISNLVASGGGGDERGLLGMAFHPDYAENGRFFLFYTNQMAAPDGRISEFRRSMADPNVADPNPTVILDIPEPAGNHNGGALEFSPVDGYLYAGVGDGGGADDAYCNGQNLDSLLGTILRLDIDQPPYAPVGNYPGALPEIFDIGLRNPWRISFDACTGDLYIGDVGQNAWEEIDVAAAGVGQQNYGWPSEEGTSCFDNQSGCPNVPACDDPGFTRPVAEYSHGQGCSVSGGYVYRGAAIPGLRGYYLYGDYCSGRTWALKWAGGSLVEPPIEITQNLQTSGMSISSFGQDASGEIYLCDLAGVVYRIEAE